LKVNGYAFSAYIVGPMCFLIVLTNRPVLRRLLMLVYHKTPHQRISTDDCICRVPRNAHLNRLAVIYHLKPSIRNAINRQRRIIRDEPNKRIRQNTLKQTNTSRSVRIALFPAVVSLSFCQFCFTFSLYASFLSVASRRAVADCVLLLYECLSVCLCVTCNFRSHSRSARTNGPKFAIFIRAIS